MRQLQQHAFESGNFVPALSLRKGWDYFEEKFHLSEPEHGSDDLDDYQAVVMETAGGKFVLLRYARYPADMVDVFIPEELKCSFEFLSQIVQDLEIPKDEVTCVR